MQRLIKLLIKYRAFLAFALMEAFCFWLIVNFNSFQGAAYFTTANGVSGSWFETKSSVQGYFSLTDQNEELLAQNAQLQTQKDSLVEQVKAYQELVLQNELLQKELLLIKNDTSKKVQPFEFRLHETTNYLPARVIKNSITGQDNYLTLAKGKADGIEQDMGVVASSGIVGRVVAVSENFSLVKSVLSQDFKVAIQFSKQKTYGTLVWNNNNEEFVGDLETIPRHLKTHVGDTVVASGYNAIFPEGTLVGTVKSAEVSDHQTWYDISVDLSTDFSNLYFVYVVKQPNNPERKEIEFKRENW